MLYNEHIKCTYVRISLVKMNILNKICAYWYDCIKNEDVLEKDISINVRTKAVLYPFDYDPFNFSNKDERVKSDDEKLNTFTNVKTEGLELYYGYPLLYYRDQRFNKELVAPLFISKLAIEHDEMGTYLSKADSYPTCGIQALTKLGLRTEEIANINEQIENLFAGSSGIDVIQLAAQAIEIIKKEADISVIEQIDPLKLTNSEKIIKANPAGLYNKSVIFAGEPTVFNIHLIKDLLDLKSRDDLDKTSLSFFSTQQSFDSKNEVIPILPFPANEYQISAIQDIFRHSLTVITGPPGTGKSQFISNLIVNLFLTGKSVLFVSHTGEAVNVVNARINEHFKNLMLRTGKKEFRQELKGRFNELLAESSKAGTQSISADHINLIWNTILEYRNTLFKKDKLEEDFQQRFFRRVEIQNFLSLRTPLFKRFKLYIESIFITYRLKRGRNELKNLPSRIDLEAKIRELEQKYNFSCEVFVRQAYLGRMLGSGHKTGLVNSFLNQVTRPRFGEEDINDSSFTNVLQVLKIWASTLKSLRGTFPLKAGIFDYVIFDEASQVDLPSAAPALYRAKKAIVVGDPMQLTHIAGITKEMDYGIAKNHGLVVNREIYPSKIRYSDVSLYRAAENSLSHPPILLTNHYRSDDQIISLCNQVFYQGRLKILSTLDYKKYPPNLPLGIQWENVSGEVYRHPAGSRINQKEVDATYKIFRKILKEISGTDLSIGIVTPYSRQRHELSAKIVSQTPETLLEKHSIKVLTAHQFQGSEKDIVIFSLVASSKGPENSDRWYNIYPQILNVSLSRARYLLYIVGDKDYCEGRDGVLGKIEAVYQKIKDEEELEWHDIHAKFDTPTERIFYEALQKVKLDKLGYKLIPKLVAKRYTLDFAIVGKKKVDIEIDGMQHEIIGGMLVLEDVERDRYLSEKEGWNILRYPNHRVLTDMPGIIEELLIELA